MASLLSDVTLLAHCPALLDNPHEWRRNELVNIALGLIATPTGLGWVLFLLYRYISVRHVRKLVENGSVHMKITMRGTEITVWREDQKPTPEKVRRAS